MSEELYKLIAVADSLATGRRLTPDASSWLLGRINNHLAHGTSLVNCYRLKQYRRELRNYWLCRSAGEFEGVPWQRAGNLGVSIGFFQETIWPNWKHFDHPPEGCSRLREYLFHARKIGTLPESQHQLHNIIRSAFS